MQGMRVIKDRSRSASGKEMIAFEWKCNFIITTLAKIKDFLTRYIIKEM